MVRSQTPDPADDQSLGDLVALATKDVSKLLRYEIDLAKTELKVDMKRVGVAAGLTGAAAFVGALVLVMLSFAYAYGLVALGIWVWAAFLIVAGTYVLGIALAEGIAYLSVRHVSGMRKTMRSVSEDLAVLRHDEGETTLTVGADGRASISRDGQPTGIAGREPR